MKTMQTEKKLLKFKTTAAYISGSITGKMWMPCSQGMITRRQDCRGVWGFFKKGDTFRDALNGILTRDGGDFQNPQFTADTVLRIERREVSTTGGIYKVHVFEREVSKLHDCADLVNEEYFSGDFNQED